MKTFTRLLRATAAAAPFLCALFFALPARAEVSASESLPYVKTIYNEQNGLPTGEANAVLQTSDGYLWIGSYGGLIRYDGTTFRNYSTDGSLSSSSIRSLFEDSKGRLWVGTNDAGVFLYENAAFTHIQSPGDYSFLCVRDFAESAADGRIYIASTSGMGEIVDGAIEVYDDPALAGETVYSIACDPTGKVWAAMNGGRCEVVKDGVPTPLADEIFPDAEVYCVGTDENHDIYIGSSENELAVLRFESDGTYDTEHFSTGDIFTHNRVTVAQDGTILVCGEHGFALLDQEGSLLMEDDTNRNMPTNDAVKDYEGNLWFASSSYGIIQYAEGCIRELGAQTDLSDIAVNAVTVANGEYYIAHDGGLLILDSDEKERENALTEMMDGMRIRHVMTDSAGNVWLATYSDYGAVRYDPETESVKTFTTKDGMVSNLIREIVQLNDGSFAAATQEGLNIISGDSVTASYTANEGLEVSAILCLAQDTDGTLYMGSDGGGIYALKDGKITNYGFREHLEEGVVLRMLANTDGSGYFISAGSNLYYWDRSDFRKLENFHRGAGSIFDFYDYDGKLWLLQNNGIIALDKETLLSGEFTSARTFSFVQGLTGSLGANTWNCLDAESGTLFISTRAGVSVFGFEGTQKPIPMVDVGGIWVDGTRSDERDGLKIAGNARRITIDFAALTYSGSSDFTIAYQLEGFDTSETILEGRSSESVSYTNLPGGNYTFRVRVFDTQHPERERTQELSFEKAKRLWEYPLFWGILLTAVLVLVGGIVALIASLRLRVARRRQDEYRRIVEQSLKTFAGTIDAKDKYTTGHSLRVAAYSRELARRMGMPKSEQERIYYIALLHDIGKIGIPDQILNKPGKLTPAEMDVIRTHPAIGGNILQNFTAIKGIEEGARYHHERYDGNGYCEHKAGEDIPQEARIIAVADTYDAMSSTRCYRAAMSAEEIVAELKRVSGTQLDPQIVPHMLAMIDDCTAPVIVPSANIEATIEAALENKKAQGDSDGSS